MTNFKLGEKEGDFAWARYENIFELGDVTANCNPENLNIGGMTKLEQGILTEIGKGKASIRRSLKRNKRRPSEGKDGLESGGN